MSKNEESINIMKRLVIDGFILIALSVCICVVDIAWIPFQRGFFCDDESLKYPYGTDTVTVPVLRLVGLLPPLLTFLVCEWRILRKDTSVQHCLGVRIPTWLRSFYCTASSFAIGLCFLELATNITKSVIGRLRPHFFSLCQPSIDCSLPEMKGRYILPQDYTCTGPAKDKFVDMHKSFMSGHSAWAAYTMIYLAMYIGARMKWCGSHSLRYTLQFIPVLLSWFCALSRVSDYKHHWSDVLVGYTVGIIFAVVVWLWGTDIVQKQKNTNTTTPPFEITVTSQQVPVQNESN